MMGTYDTRGGSALSPPDQDETCDGCGKDASECVCAEEPAKAPRPTDKQIAEWLLATMDMFGVSLPNQYKVASLFLEAINAESCAPAADK